MLNINQSRELARAPTEPRLVRLGEVLQRTGIGKTRLYELIRNNQFPPPQKLCGGRTNYWLAADLDLWIEERFARPRAAQEASLEGWLFSPPPLND